MRHNAAYKNQILDRLDPKISEGAKSIRALADRFEENILKSPISFKIGDYVVIIDATGARDNPDIRISCTCDYWKYQGPEYHAKQGDYLYGSPRGTAEKPEKRDPDNTHKICKHAYAVLRDFF